MILVTVGTHPDPFDRLVRAAERLAGEEEVIVQRGTSRLQPAGCRVVDLVAPEVLADWAAQARVVIGHAGPGTLALAWDAGKVPVVVPRDPRHGEHVDDHQLRTAARLGDTAWVTGPEALPEALLAWSEALADGRLRIPPRPDPRVFALRLGAVVDEVVAERRRRWSSALGVWGRLWGGRG